MADLITRLEALTGPDREVDAEIYAAVNGGEVDPVGDPGTVKFPGRYRCTAPKFTASVDAALTLVPEGADDWPYWIIKSKNPNVPWLRGYHGGAEAQIWLEGKNPVAVVRAATPAIALCIAALKAREKTDG